MGTTADKLTYLNETKNKIKEAVGSTSNNFRDYVEEINYINQSKNQALANQKVLEAEGEYIYVKDSADMPCEIGIKGNIEQDTRQGYNKVSFRNGSETQNGMTSTARNGKIILNGTATAVTKFFIPLLNKFTILQNEAVTMQAFNPVAYTGVAGDLRLRVVDASYVEQIVFNITGVNSSLSAKASASVDFEVAYLLIRIESGITLSNFELTPQIVLGTEAKPYEQYGAMPSLEFESPVKHVGGKVKSYNLFDKSANILTSRYFGTSGEISTSSAGNNYLQEKYIEVKANTNYFFSTATYIRICEYDSEKNFIKISNSGTSTNITITTSSTTKYIRVSFVGNLDTFQITEGTSSKPYLPYGEVGSVYDIAKVNKNICSGIESGNINSSGVNYDDTASIRSKNYDLVQPNTSYIASKNGVVSTFNVSEYDSNKTFIKRTYYSNGLFTTSSTTKYVKVQTSGSTTDVIQIEKGNVITDYTLHQQENYSLDLTNLPLYSKNDYIYKSGDKWFVHNEVTKFILDGTKLFILGNPANRYYLDIELNNKNYLAKSNCFKSGAENNFNTMNTVVLQTNRINLMTDEFSNVDELNAKILELYNSGNPLYITYELATPTETEITDEKVIAQLEDLLNNSTYEGGTNIYTISVGVNPILKLKYYMSINALTNTILELGGSI